jgi:hypothetical protein
VPSPEPDTLSHDDADPAESSAASAIVPSARSLRFPDPIPGIIPFGTLTVVAGAPGVGKTAMLAEWIVRWRDGKTICGKQTHKPTAFYYIAADRQWQSHQIWFDAAGYPDIPHYSLADDDLFDLNRLRFPQYAWSCFEDCFKSLSPIPGSHVFVDPASPLFISGDPNRARDVAVSMLRFSRLCRTHALNITCAAHFGKQKNDSKEQYTRPQDRIAGSGAFSGFSDTQIYMVDPCLPHQPYHVLGWVPRHSAPEEFNYVRGDKGLFIPYQDYVEETQLEQILECVPFEPLSTEGIINHVRAGYPDFSQRTIERKLTILLKQHRIVKVRRGVYQRTKPS